MTVRARLVAQLENKRIDFASPSVEPLLGLLARYVKGWEIIKLLDQFKLPKQMHLVDVGACIGSWGIAMAEHYPDSVVTCIEPYPTNYECLIYNTKNFTNIRTLRAAVSSKKCKINLSLPDISLFEKDHRPIELWNNYGLITAFGEPDREMVEVPAFKLDDLVRNVSVLKLDVEGMELDVLAGAQRILTIDRPVLQIECIERNQKRAGHTTDEIDEVVLSYGYELFGTNKVDNYYIHPDNMKRADEDTAD